MKKTIFTIFFVTLFFLFQLGTVYTQSDVLIGFYTVFIDGFPLEEITLGESPYIYTAFCGEVSYPDNIVVPLKTFLKSLNRATDHAGIDKFDEQNQIVDFHYEKLIFKELKYCQYRFIWNLKTNDVSVKIYLALDLGRKKYQFVKEDSYRIGCGYYGYGHYHTGIKQIWVPIAPIARIIWGEKRCIHINGSNLEIPTCLCFPDRDTLFIFTDYLTPSEKKEKN